jgi:hypothetical protein
MSPESEPSVTSGRLYFYAGLIFIAGAVVIFWPWLSGAVTIPWDAKAQAFSQLAFLARSLASGDSPFWTPNVFTGHPQIADPQSQIFSPPFLLLALFDSEPSFRAADAVPFVMLVLAGLAMIAFFKDRGWHAAGGLVTAFAFSFGGSNAWRLQHVGEVISLCWFAITLFALARGLERRSILYGFMSGVCAGLMVLGRDQIALLCVFILACYAIAQFLVSDWRVKVSERLPVLSAGFIGGTLVVAVPLALTFALADQSNRPEISIDGAIGGSLPPFSLLSAVVSNLYGVDGPLTEFWGPPAAHVWGENNLALARNMGAIYFGAVPLVALLGALVALTQERIRLFAALVLVMALYAVGKYTPFFALIYGVPGVDLYRRPADATFPLAALLAICGGYGVHVLLKCRRDFRWSHALVLIITLFAACVVVAIWKERFAQATLPLIIGAASLSAALILLVFLPRLMKRAPIIALCGIGLVMTADLAVNNKPNESTAAPPSAYDVLRFGSENETLALISRELKKTSAPDRRDRVELAAIDYNWPNAGLVHGFDHDLGFNPIRMKLYADATNAQDQIAVPEQRTFSPLYAGFNSPLADLMGVRLILSRYPLERMDPSFNAKDFVSLGQTKDAFVWQNPRALPRVMMVGSVQAADFDAMIKSGNWPQIDFKQTVLLSGVDIKDQTQRPSGTARLVSYRNTIIDVEVTSPQGGYLVLNDQWHPWWRAEIDGKPASLLRANVMFRAVAVEAGTHRIRFSFHPLQGLLTQLRAR